MNEVVIEIFTSISIWLSSSNNARHPRISQGKVSNNILTGKSVEHRTLKFTKKWLYTINQMTAHFTCPITPPPSPHTQRI